MPTSGHDVSNNETMAQATATPVPQYSNNSAIYLYPVCIFGAIALVLVILRIFTRLTRTRKLYVDDWLIVAAEPLSLINICLGGAAVAYGWGKPYALLTPSEAIHTLKLQFAVQTTWIVTLCLVRLSVACSLLRFGQSRAWKWTLYILMGMQVLISSSWIVIQFGQCRPVSSNWEAVPDVECWDVNAVVDYGWAIGAVYIIMDLILSLMPIKLVRTLTRPLSEKILIGCLMALGLLATAVACAKMTTFNDFGKGDPMQATVKPSMFAKLEEIVGIIASSLPCLKSPAENMLRKFGILKEHQLSRPSFVHSVPLPDVPKDHQNHRSSSDGSLPSGKGDIRVDSVAFKSGSANSNRDTGKQNASWEAV